MPEFTNGQFTFDRFAFALKELGGDNNICPKLDAAKWPGILNYHYLDAQLNRLSDEEIIIFVAGEDTEAQALALQYKIQDIHDLFNDIFDGNLYSYFFKD